MCGGWNERGAGERHTHQYPNRIYNSFAAYPANVFDIYQRNEFGAIFHIVFNELTCPYHFPPFRKYAIHISWPEHVAYGLADIQNHFHMHERTI